MLVFTECKILIQTEADHGSHVTVPSEGVILSFLFKPSGTFSLDSIICECIPQVS